MFHIEFFSQGRTADSNDDSWVIHPTMFAVIDSATLPPSITYNNMTAGKYANILIEKAVRKIPSSFTGVEAINAISQSFYESLEKDGFIKTILSAPEKRPFAKIALTQVIADMVIITQLGTVGVRVNGTQAFVEKNSLDIVHADTRIKAIQKACIENPEVSLDEVSRVGTELIYPSLYKQVVGFLNNADHPLGYGGIDGRTIPEKFIRVMTFPLSTIETIELFTDGYFKIPDEVSIPAWENAFREVEHEDPHKIHAYAATRGSTNTSFTDDRTVLIVKAKR